MKIEVALSPELYPYRTIKEKHVTVAVDVLRATTAVCAAFEAGCEAVVPLASLEGLSAYAKRGYKLAAERGGKKVDLPTDDGGTTKADYGNSPTEYLRQDMRGVRLAYSTTNGTVCILRGADAEKTTVGALANISALAAWLKAEGKDVVVLCSGWEGNFCIEDTLCAGAIIEATGGEGEPLGDAAVMAADMWQAAKDDPYGYCTARCSHVERLHRLGADEDVRFAMRADTCGVVPILKNGILTL